MINKQELKRLEIKLSTQMNNNRHVTNAANLICMACVRTDISLKLLIDKIEDGTAFDLKNFISDSQGNIYNYVDSKFKNTSKYFVDITAGGNGGMASVGRGEIFGAFLSNFKISMSKSGKGDWHLPTGTFEEVKFNGGKIIVDDKSGREIQERFNLFLKNCYSSVNYTAKTYVPFRKADQRIYTPTTISYLNACFWKAVSNKPASFLTNQELRNKSIEKAFEKVFKKSNSIIAISESGEFIRFKDEVKAISYYKNKGHGTRFEYRANQTNPFSIYLEL
jgi:hypothetical protein